MLRRPSSSSNTSLHSCITACAPMRVMIALHAMGRSMAGLCTQTFARAPAASLKRPFTRVVPGNEMVSDEPWTGMLQVRLLQRTVSPGAGRQ